MSALPPKADITAAQTNVRFVPKADVNARSLRSPAGSGRGLCQHREAVTLEYRFGRSVDFYVSGCNRGHMI